MQSGKIKNLEARISETRSLLQHEKQKTEEQRVGRTRAERELRRFMNENAQNPSSTTAPTNGIQPIGYIESCFRERNGTPRQGLLVPKGRGLLRLKLPWMDAGHTLEGLDQYSHVWIIFIFHENTNVMRGVRKDRRSSAVKAKVRPPRLDGIKVGLFSTRTPHRPNPIGLSVARVDRIEGGCVYLSCIDLIDGTPVLDIKPYIPSYDSLPDATAPSWTSDAPVSPLQGVVFQPDADTELARLVPALRFYNKHEDIRAAIEQVLLLDIRSVRRRRQDRNSEMTSDVSTSNEEEGDFDGDDDAGSGGPQHHRFAIDVLNVVFIVSSGIATVLKVEIDQMLPDNWPKPNIT
jgi:tRNA-Thr(GGU) m(6)t(6)A37 methyltransferase TsaA